MVPGPITGIPAPARALVESFGVEPIARLLQGMAASTIPIAVFDPQDRLVYSCPDFASLYAMEDGAQTFSSIIRHCHAIGEGPLIATNDIDAWLDRAQQRRRAVPHRRFEIDFVDGRWFQALETTYDDGWILLVLVDLTAFKTKEAKLETARDAAIEQARTDALTGLASRGAIMAYLESAVRAPSPAQPLSIALLDLDHFKQINDTQGHDAGDEVLSLLGRQLSAAFRNSDRAGRVGGEEFLLVLPGADETAAWMALQRFRRHWQRANQLLPMALGSTFSAGIAQWEYGQSATALYRAANQALYRAKAAGRDCMVCANGTMDDMAGTLPGATGTDAR